VIKYAHERPTVSRWTTPQLTEQPPQEPEEEVSESLDELRQRAFDQGFTEGYKAGIDQAEEEVRAQFTTLAQLLDAVSRPLVDIDEQVLNQLALLAGRIARQLVKRELRTEPETIMALVRDCVAVLGSGNDKIRIHLHPDDAQVIQRLTQTAGDRNRWDVVEDPLVAHGDCKVASLDSVVSGELQTRVNAMIWQCLGDDRA
jgi:flagellar assembly protein FliH